MKPKVRYLCPRCGSVANDKLEVGHKCKNTKCGCQGRGFVTTYSVTFDPTLGGLRQANICGGYRRISKKRRTFNHHDHHS